MKRRGASTDSQVEGFTYNPPGRTDFAPSEISLNTSGREDFLFYFAIFLLNLPPAPMPPPPTILLSVRTVLVSVLCRHGGVTCGYQCCASGRCCSALLCSALCVRCFLADCLCVCFSLLPLRPLCAPPISGPSCQCSAIVHLRAAHLGSCHSHGSCLCHSVPHQSDRSQLRQSPSVLLPLCRSGLAAGGQVRAPAGPEYSEYVTVTPALAIIIHSHRKHSLFLIITDARRRELSRSVPVSF